MTASCRLGNNQGDLNETRNQFDRCRRSYRRNYVSKCPGRFKQSSGARDAGKRFGERQPRHFWLRAGSRNAGIGLCEGNNRRVRICNQTSQLHFAFNSAGESLRINLCSRYLIVLSMRPASIRSNRESPLTSKFSQSPAPITDIVYRALAIVITVDATAPACPLGARTTSPISLFTAESKIGVTISSKLP